jgi:hypothetical protein
MPASRTKLPDRSFLGRDLPHRRSAPVTRARKNDDGTISFITIDPTNDGFEFVVSETREKAVLVIRDGQHEYFFTETT